MEWKIFEQKKNKYINKTVCLYNNNIILHLLITFNGVLIIEFKNCYFENFIKQIQ